MSTDSPLFDLSELARATDVTPRTIRYYVQQGLLAPPGSRGPGARYDEGHRDRLILIRRWQRLHLPLAEVRRRLEQMDDEAVRRALQEGELPRLGSALDYLHGVMASRETGEGVLPAQEFFSRRADASMSGDAPTFRRNRPTGDPDHPLAAPAPLPAEQPSTSPAPARSTWERIPLSPDIELHLRRPLTREDNRAADRLLDFARHLFREES